MELTSFLLQDTPHPRVKAGCVLGHICLRDKNGALEANTVNRINFVFLILVLYLYILCKIRGSIFLGNPRDARKFDARVAQGSFVS